MTKTDKTTIMIQVRTRVHVHDAECACRRTRHARLCLGVTHAHVRAVCMAELYSSHADVHVVYFLFLSLSLTLCLSLSSFVYLSLLLSLSVSFSLCISVSLKAEWLATQRDEHHAARLGKVEEEGVSSNSLPLPMLLVGVLVIWEPAVLLCYSRTSDPAELLGRGGTEPGLVTNNCEGWSDAFTDFFFFFTVYYCWPSLCSPITHFRSPSTAT